MYPAEKTPCGLLAAKPQITKDPRLPQSSKVVNAVYSANNCVLDFGERTKMSQDCLGNETYASGKVKLNAKQTKHGIRRFQNETDLVIPWPDNQHEYDLDIEEFHNFKVWVSNKQASLNIVSGKASAKIIVHLSQDPQSGLCTIPTPEITVKHIRYADSTLESPGMLGSVQVPVQKSDIAAQVGKFGDNINSVSGGITMWEEEYHVPSDNKGFATDYNEAEHLKTFQCRLGDRSKLPDYECDAMSLFSGDNIFEPSTSDPEPHAYLKKGYNELASNPQHAVSKFLEIAFPEVYGRELQSFNGHFKLQAGYSKAKIIILPDLAGGLSTRASTMQYIQRHIESRDAVLFVHDPINQNGHKKDAPQSFSCIDDVFLRAPHGIEQSEFNSAFRKQSIQLRPKIKKWIDCKCYRLGLATPSPEQIEKYIKLIGRSDFPPTRYFVVMDQRQMPGQVYAQYNKQHWDSAFGENGYMMLIDLYAKTDRE